MWLRSEMKDRAKISLKGAFWISVLVVVLYAVLTGGESSNMAFKIGQDAGNNNLEWGNLNLERMNDFDFYGYLIAYPMTMFFALFSALAFLMSVLWNILFVGPLEMGLSRYFLENRKNQKENSPRNLFSAFDRDHYLNTVVVFFMRNLFIFLFFLLLIIPGIIKSYAYSFVPWIMAENPQMKYQEALALSTKMTDGEKWNIFVLDLSFIGWAILAAMTLGLGTPLVTTYHKATVTELYLKLAGRDAVDPYVESTPPYGRNNY